MGRLLVFLATAAALLAANAALNWWVDPFGNFWKPGAVAAARSERPRCLVSHELVGSEYFPFKLDVFRSRPTRTFVVGSSRVLKIAARPGELAFANLGMPVITPETVLALLRRLPRGAPAQTMYLGTELFWFNPAFSGRNPEPGFETQTRYVLSRSALESSLRLVRADPWLLVHRWRRERLGHACVIGRARPALAWRLDGSRVWSFELQPGTYHPAPDPFTTNLRVLRTGSYGDWHAFSRRRLAVLDEVLALARARGWRVVGFAPPDGTRYVRFFSSSRLLGPYWREFGQTMPRVFARHGYPWLDLRTPASIPCTDADFVDGGYHTNAACSARIRRRLDAAARRLPFP